MFKKLKSIIINLLEANFVIRFAILTFLGALGGSSYIGFISEFASYYYAWDVGFRIPAEGIPFLKLTVSALSFIAISLGVLVFSLVYFIGQSILWYVSKTKFGFKVFGLGTGVEVDFSDFIPILQNMPFKKILPIAISMAIVASIAGVAAPILDESIIISQYILSPALFIGVFFFVLIIWNRKVLITFATAFSLVAGFVIPNVLFDSNTYADLLRHLKYGGEIEVKVTPTYSNTPKSFKLLLRTTSSLIVKTEAEEVIEIPNTRINKISYGFVPKT